MEFAWDTADGARHNFSHASHPHIQGLFVAAAPCAELRHCGAVEDDDFGARMMAFTSWLDLVCKCKVKHIVCLMGDDDLRQWYAGLGDGDLASTCRGQGLSFRQASQPHSWPSARALADAVLALRRLPSLRAESAVLVCADGQHASAAAAVAWLAWECGMDVAKAVHAVETAAAEVGATRAPLAPFGGQLELFKALLADARDLAS